MQESRDVCDINADSYLIFIVFIKEMVKNVHIHTHNIYNFFCEYMLLFKMHGSLLCFYYKQENILDMQLYI